MEEGGVMIKISELREKEVINIRDGSKIGVIEDIEVDLTKGEVTAIVIPKAGKMFRIFSKNDDTVIKWKNIVKIGIDTILVDLSIEE